ncbi:hypothetical protein R1sor_024551 [Riccia sorocarpa]|uniref:DNA methylase N-4/N-6 domain-containing protein n=1 Tax=Riccia sorocarpa TaxID=122646 RepID=A0ABD3GU24_9MARC
MQDGLNVRKKLKVFEGKFRQDVYFPMKNRCVVVKGSLRDTHEKLQGNKGKSVKDPVPIIEHLKSICSSLETRRLAEFQMNKKQAQAAVDCLYLDLSSRLKIHPDDPVPTWNVFLEKDDLPRKLMGLGRSILDDRGCLMILHQGTLRSAQQIADALDAYSQVWKQIATLDVQSDLPQYDPLRNTKVYHSKVEVFYKAFHNFIIPKLDMPPFDDDNNGRDSFQIINYNHTCTSKLDDGDRRKCAGFVQTLLENFTGQGDIVIDFVGGCGATLQAAHNSGRCCIVAETQKEALESLHRVLSSLHEPTVNNPDLEPQTKKSLGKKPLGDEDDLGDLGLGDE